MVKKGCEKMGNSDKKIVSLCSGTGSWEKPYFDNGYDVYSVTLPEQDVRLYIPPDNVHGILAAPPCTQFSLAKGSHPRDFRAGMEIVESCMRIIWRCRYTGSLKWWCMENPTGFLRQFLGLPAWTFEQWQFGELLVKRTDLWGYFKRPRPTVRKKPEQGMTVRYPNGKTNARCWSKSKCPSGYAEMNLSRAAVRAITPPGFAKAFFESNP